MNDLNLKWPQIRLIWSLIILFSIFSCEELEMQPTFDASQEVKVIQTKAMAARLSATRLVNEQEPVVLGYFPSWSESWTSTGQGSKLRDIPEHVNYVFLAFARPNLTYTKGSYDIAGTGIQTPYGGATLKESVDALKSKGINVILSMGGETYWATDAAYNINYQQIKDLVDDMGFAGIDWDFEPSGSFATIGDQVNVDRFIDFFNQSRAIMPKGEYVLACAPAGVGAIGGVVNDDPGSPFAFANRNQVTGESDANLYSGTVPNAGISLFGFSSTGHMIPVIQAVGDKIDLIALQGYNTGAATNRQIMYDAYRHYANQYGFTVVAGTHFPNEPWGPYFTYTHQNVGELAAHIKSQNDANNGNDGIMIWQLLLSDAASSAYGYLHVASQVLNGTSVSTAVTNAENYPESPYSGDTGGGDQGDGSDGGTPGTTCDTAPQWSASAVYTGGQYAMYNADLYRAKWWTQGNIPSESTGSGQPWELASDCDGSGNDGSGNDGSGNDGSGNDGSGNDGSGNDGSGNDGSGNDGGGGDTSCEVAAWEAYPTIYNTGDRVNYNGIIYEAQTGPIWVTPGAGEHWWKTIGPCESGS